MTSWRWLVLASVAACASNSTPAAPQQQQLARAVAPPSRLEPPVTLSGTARVALRTRMANHARDMGALVSAIMVLDYDQIQERATTIADDASLARPLTADATELNSMLPDQFFVHQDQLRGQARALAEAARRKHAMDTAGRYGALAETCVQCHATYRAGRR